MSRPKLWLHRHGRIVFGFIELDEPLSISELAAAYRTVQAADAAVFGTVKLRNMEDPKRPKEQYLAVIPEARNIPHEEFESLVKSLLPKGEVEITWTTKTDARVTVVALMIRELLNDND